jgi:hypothetical protein
MTTGSQMMAMVKLHEERTGKKITQPGKGARHVHVDAPRPPTKVEMLRAIAASVSLPGRPGPLS